MPKLRRSRDPASVSASASNTTPRTDHGGSRTLTSEDSFTAPAAKRFYTHEYRVRPPHKICRENHWDGRCSSALVGTSMWQGGFLCSAHTDALIAVGVAMAEEQGIVPPSEAEVGVVRGRFRTPPYFDRSGACQSCDRDWSDQRVGALRRSVSLMLPDDTRATRLPSVVWYCADCAASRDYYRARLSEAGYSEEEGEYLELRLDAEYFVPDIEMSEESAPDDQPEHDSASS